MLGVEDIWPLIMKDDFDMSMLKNVQLSNIYMYAKYQVSISTGLKLWPKLYIWPLTLKNDLNHVTIQNVH